MDETFRSGSGQVLQLLSVFQIPEVSSSSAFIIVQVKGSTQEFIKRKSIHIAKAESLVFVQTDKPIYKPGQTGIRNQMSKFNFRGEGQGRSLLLYSAVMEVLACYCCAIILDSHWRISWEKSLFQ